MNYSSGITPRFMVLLGAQTPVTCPATAKSSRPNFGFTELYTNKILSIKFLRVNKTALYRELKSHFNYRAII